MALRGGLKVSDGCTGTEREGAGGAVHGQCSETEMYREGGGWRSQ